MIGAGTHSGQLNLALGVAENVLCRLLGAFLCERNGRKTDRLAVGVVNQGCRKFVLGKNSGAEKQRTEQNNYSKKLHNSILTQINL